jgi:DNA-binding NarL/FixJ family response regulator
MRVLIIAEGGLAAEGIRRGLRHAPSCRVLGFANGRIPCGPTVTEAAPDIVVIDEMRDSQATLARIREARAAVPTAKLLLLSADMSPSSLAEASAAGIDAAIAKTAHLASVGMLVREVAAGNVYHAFAAAPVEVQDTGATDMLTARELEILRLVAAGLSNNRIAAQLWVAEQTVKFHLSNIYRKLGLANRTEASHYAHMHGLLGAPARIAAGPESLPVAA